jgi:hypothetical protein
MEKKPKIIKVQNPTGNKIPKIIRVERPPLDRSSQVHLLVEIPLKVTISTWKLATKIDKKKTTWVNRISLEKVVSST